MSNIQAQEMIAKVKDVSTKAILTMCDDGISILYCQGFLTQTQMRALRQKLIKRIQKHLPKEATNDR